MGCERNPEHDFSPSYVFAVGSSAFLAGVAPAIMCPLCAIQFAHVQRHIPRLVPNTHRFRHVRSESWHGGAPLPSHTDPEHMHAAPSYRAPQSQLMHDGVISLGTLEPPIIVLGTYGYEMSASRHSFKVTPHYSRVQPLGTRTFDCTANRRGHSQQTLLFRVWPPPIH
ncbi:hypothetical protein EDB83DRAFT_2340312 [Lactarius deliciosus]|nr:hypothetical protein EDB83DRAFT_2340312 [Lactarius deliciosus]